LIEFGLVLRQRSRIHCRSTRRSSKLRGAPHRTLLHAFVFASSDKHSKARA